MNATKNKLQVARWKKKSICVFKKKKQNKQMDECKFSFILFMATCYLVQHIIAITGFHLFYYSYILRRTAYYLFLLNIHNTFNIMQMYL